MTPNLDHVDPSNSCGSVRIPRFPPAPPRVVTWACDECEGLLKDREILMKHKLNGYLLRRPSLHIRGLEASTQRYTITRMLGAECLRFEDTHAIHIDGRICESTDSAA